MSKTSKTILAVAVALVIVLVLGVVCYGVMSGRGPVVERSTAPAVRRTPAPRRTR